MASAYRRLSVVKLPSSKSSWPAPWIFSILILPQGIYLGFVSTSLPFLLSRAGTPVDQIAHVTSLLSLPWILNFLWAPLIDVKLRRRVWLVLAAATTALCLSIALPLAGMGRVALLVALGMAGAVAASIVLSACGGLMVAVLSVKVQARAAAWYEAGKLGSSAISAAFTLWLVERVSLIYTGLGVAILVALPALAAFTIPESKPVQAPWFQGRIAAIGREMRAVFRSGGIWNVLILASPAGAGGAAALLPAIANHYGVGSAGVAWANGIGGGMVLALGALCATFLPEEWDRRLTYAGAGLTNGLAAMTLLSAHRPGVYYVGTIFYLFTLGLSWARFSALLIQTVGTEGEACSTRYSVFAAVGNIPLAYMVWLDGFGFKHFGLTGLILIDAGGNILTFAATAIALGAYRIRFRRGSDVT